ncbi:MAG: YraN family protein [Christensenellales bacterium]
MKTRELGRSGEQAAGRYLESLGCRIVARNYRTRQGEVDLIALDGETVVFAEVKTRRSQRAGSGAESVTARKQEHIIRAALAFLQERGMEEAPARFDVIELLYAREGFRIRHIRDAFGSTGF